MIADLKFAVRQLVKSPLFTVISVFSLALGIGAGVAVFSVANAVLLKSLPVPNPQDLRVITWYGKGDHIAKMGGSNPDGPGGQATFSGFSQPAFLALQEQAKDQADVFAYASPGEGSTARVRREAVNARLAFVSDNFFSGLGVRPFIGRLITADTGKPDKTSEVDISYSWWKQQFDGDSGALGKQVAINGHEFVVAGILPRGFQGPNPARAYALYVRLTAQPLIETRWPNTKSPTFWWLSLMARVQPGVTTGQLRAILDVGLKNATETLSKTAGEFSILVTAGRGGEDWDRQQYAPELIMLLGVVGVVLLVACANLAGLLIARGAKRRHEFAVRISLGAGRGRLVRQLLTEAFLLSLIGGTFGTLIAIWGKNILSTLLGATANNIRYDTSLDFKVLGFTLLVSLVTAVFSGLLPAVKASRTNAVAGLKDRVKAGTKSRNRIGWMLVATQIVLSLALVVGGSLYVRTLINLTSIDPGFSVENLMLFRVDPQNASYNQPQTAAYYQNVERGLAAIPGVESVGLSSIPLLANWVESSNFRFVDHAEVENPSMLELVVSETFFHTLGIPILLGRNLASTDTNGAPNVIVVNQAFVRKYLPGEYPIGHRIATGSSAAARVAGAVWEIVGVCQDTKYQNVVHETSPTVYYSFRQNSPGSAFLILRTRIPPPTIAAEARKVVAALDPNIPLDHLTTQAALRDSTFGPQRTFAALCGTLAALSLLLSSIGLYGLIAYDVQCRTVEMGIRQALGATRGQIIGPILKQAILLVGFGVAVGVPFTLALTRVVRTNLYGLSATDPSTYVAASLLFFVVALLASWIPARRAAAVDPMVALRAE